MIKKKRIEKNEIKRPLIKAAVLTAGLALGCGGSSKDDVTCHCDCGDAGTVATGGSTAQTGGRSGEAGSAQTGAGGEAGSVAQAGRGGNAGENQAGSSGEAGAGGQTCSNTPCRGVAQTIITDFDAGSQYTEDEAIWTAEQGTANDLVVSGNYETYSITFTGPGSLENGIPVCTDHENGDYTACKNGNIDDATETHRILIHAFGETWIVSEMNAPYETVASERQVARGGSIKLAKESIGGILNQGEQLEVNDLKFQLDDLEAHGDVTAAIISILDTNDNILERQRIDPGETQQISINGERYRFHVYSVAAGYTFGAKWADVAIFSDEIELVNGQELNAAEGNYPGLYVSLHWTNRDLTSGNTDSLKHIVVHNETVCSERTTCE